MPNPSNKLPTFAGEFVDQVPADVRWQDIINMVEDLPPLPNVAARALSLIEDPNVSGDELGGVLSSDPALVAKLLRIANSAMFARQREITTINQAITIVGMQSIKSIVVAASLRKINKRFGKIERLIWENSLCTAMGAHVLAQYLKKPFLEEVFLLGLIHDLGKIVFVNHSPEEYEKVIEATKDGLLFHEAEEQIFRFSHPLIGALVAKKWNFASETCQIILCHHEGPKDSFSAEQIAKVKIVQAADGTAHLLGYGHVAGYPDSVHETYKAFAALGINQDSTDLLIKRIKEFYISHSALF